MEIKHEGNGKIWLFDSGLIAGVDGEIVTFLFDVPVRDGEEVAKKINGVIRRVQTSERSHSAKPTGNSRYATALEVAGEFRESLIGGPGCDSIDIDDFEEFAEERLNAEGHSA